MAQAGIERKQILEITECSICKESFEEPKCLPCIHTFCLQCLEKYGEDNNPGGKVNCPLCRKEYFIPQRGFKDLPNNYFIIQLLQLKKQHSKHETQGLMSGQDVVCDLCCELNEKPPAARYCIDCEQHLCQPCCVRHGIQNSSRMHRVVSLEEKPNVAGLRKMMPSYCEKHPSKEIEFYCYDCKSIACVMCYVDHKLSQHRCSDVKESAEILGTQIKENIDSLLPYLARSRDEIKQLEDSKISLKDKVMTTKIAIANKFGELRAILKSHQNQLMTELDSFQSRRIKELETRKMEVERQLVILESFSRYCGEVKDKGTSCDVSRAAGDLHTRTEELVKSQEEFTRNQLNPVDIRFMPSQCSLGAADNDNVNWIGQLALGGMDASLIIVGLDNGPTIANDVYRISLQHEDNVAAMNKIPTEMSGESRACVRDNNVYITGIGGKRPHNETWRLDLLSGNWFRCADMITGRRRHCAVIIDSQLYILGGWFGADSTTLSNVECYNIATDTWSEAGNLVHAVWGAACITYKKSIYVFSGCEPANGEEVAHVQVYEPTVETKCTLLDQQIPHVCYPWRAVQWETYVILMNRHKCLVYNFETTAWQEKKQFIMGLNHFGLALYKENVYIAGGGTSNRDDKDQIKSWVLSDEIKSVFVRDIIEDRNPVVWQHHAKLPKPAMIESYCLFHV